MELREWFATFLFVQVPGRGFRGGVWGGVESRGGINCGEWGICFFTIQVTNCFKETLSCY